MKFSAGDFSLDDAPCLGRPVEAESDQIKTLIENRNAQNTSFFSALLLCLDEAISDLRQQFLVVGETTSEHMKLTALPSLVGDFIFSGALQIRSGSARLLISLCPVKALTCSEFRTIWIRLLRPFP